jgi:hypothetical protein
MKSDGDLRRLFRKYLPEVFWTSIESRLTQGGIPDLHGIYKGTSFWIENKKARGNTVRLRAMQIGWLKRYARQGGRCFVAVRMKDTLWIVDGADALTLATKGLHRGLIARGPTTRWPWRTIRTRFAG